MELLQLVYEKLVVPEAVMRELLELEKRGIDLALITQADWIEIIPVIDHKFVVSFQQSSPFLRDGFIYLAEKAYLW